MERDKEIEREREKRREEKSHNCTKTVSKSKCPHIYVRSSSKACLVHDAGKSSTSIFHHLNVDRICQICFFQSLTDLHKGREWCKGPESTL